MICYSPLRGEHSEKANRECLKLVTTMIASTARRPTASALSWLVSKGCRCIPQGNGLHDLLFPFLYSDNVGEREDEDKNEDAGESDVSWGEAECKSMLRVIARVRVSVTVK